MKNIITVLDAHHQSQGAIDLSCYLTKLTGATLSGIFPAYPTDTHTPFARFIHDSAPSVVENQRKAQQIEDAIAHFRQICLQQDMDCRIHRNIDDPATDLVTETLFADVLIVDEAVSFSDADNKVPSKFVISLLSHAKCPVIIAAASFQPIEEIILAYDGSYSSLFAIKQFTYLFPELHDRKIVVVEVTDTGEIVESDRLGDWLDLYYTGVVYETLAGNPGDRLFELMMSRRNVLLVTGAFGRNTLSSLFTSSTADKIIKVSSNAVFIAHH